MHINLYNLHVTFNIEITLYIMCTCTFVRWHFTCWCVLCALHVDYTQSKHPIGRYETRLHAVANHSSGGHSTSPVPVDLAVNFSCPNSEHQGMLCGHVSNVAVINFYHLTS